MEDKEIKQLIVQHQGFTKSLENLLESLLKANDIKYHLVEHRTKGFDSLKEKIKRKDVLDIRKYITDLSGLRIILYYQSDIIKVEKLINENFDVDPDNSIDKAKTLANNEFGYLSVHYIIKLNDKRSELDEWKLYKDLIAEIQVRTILQHSWAAINHELVYKSKVEMPAQLERKLFRLAGLFELADEQFEDLKSKDDKIEQDYIERRGKEVFNDEHLNFLILKTDFENPQSQLKSIVEDGYTTGFVKSERDFHNEDISKILVVSKMLNIRTFSELVAALKAKADKLTPTLAEMLANVVGGKWGGGYGFLVFINLLFHFSQEELEKLTEQMSFSPTLWEIIKNAIANNR